MSEYRSGPDSSRIKKARRTRVASRPACGTRRESYFFFFFAAFFVANALTSLHTVARQTPMASPTRFLHIVLLQSATAGPSRHTRRQRSRPSRLDHSDGYRRRNASNGPCADKNRRPVEPSSGATRSKFAKRLCRISRGIPQLGRCALSSSTNRISLKDRSLYSNTARGDQQKSIDIQFGDGSMGTPVWDAARPDRRSDGLVTLHRTQVPYE